VKDELEGMLRAVATLLIVDDDRKMVEFLTAHLGPMGYKCYVEVNGERALDVLGSTPVDLLVLDVMLPGLSGFQLCRKIRTNPEHFGLPIIFLSAMDSDEEIAHGLAQGADDYMTKPFKTEELVRRIEGLLSSSAQHQVNDPVTSLANAKSTKLAVQKAVNEKSAFVLAYFELLRIGEFGRVLGPDARSKALRHFARLMLACVEEIDAPVFHAGHLGGGHFVAMISTEAANTYTKMIVKAWDRHLPKLYRDLGQEKAYAQAQEKGSKTSPLPILEPLICMTGHNPGTQVSSVEHFEILSRLRQNALTQGPGIFVDRRQ